MSARVLIVDDMALYRSVLSRSITAADGLTVVGKAADGRDGLRQIESLQPDLVVLDLEMPEMTGIEVLKKLRTMRLTRRPKVVVFSAQSAEGAAVTMAALRLGATDFVLKPTAAKGVAAIEEELIPKLQQLAGSRIKKQRGPRIGTDTITRTGRRRLLIIGSSTGGPPALEKALSQFPASFAVPVLVVQHMPALFTATMSANLDRRCALSVVEARDGQPLCPGQVAVAPGDYHLVLEGGADGIVLRTTQTERVYSLRPAVDVTLRSLTTGGIGARQAVLAIFTGMGQDGLEGASSLAPQGLDVLTQTADSCVVYGMPRAIDEAGLSNGHFTPESLFDVVSGYTWAW